MEPQIYIAPGPFELETGHTLPELRIAYHTYGTLNAAKDNVAWVCHALTANSDVADWWPHTVEAGRFLDPARHFVVCANIIGSHYGTTGPLHVNPATGRPWYKDFPPFTIRDIVRALNISHARMEQGNMRADVNVSLRNSPSDPFGTRSETKNVNSFRGIEKTIQYEIRRQAAILSEGGEILQETRHWDEASQTTAGGRVKSDADDYRYFPDPDLVMLHITKEHIEEMKAQMPEMPRERRNRLKGEWDFNDLEMRDVLNADALDLLEETVKAGATAAGAKKWWLGELSREANNKGVSLEELPITPADVAEVEKLIADGKLNDKLAKQTVEGVLKGEGTPDEVVKKHGFQVVSDDGALEKAVDEALAANPDIVEKLKSGNMKPMGAIIGAVMRATRGQADAKAVTKIVMSKIK